MTSTSWSLASYHTFSVWGNSSLLCFQALIASYLSKGDYVVATEITHYALKVCASLLFCAVELCKLWDTLHYLWIWTYTLQIGLVAGVFLAAALGVSFGSLSTLFTKDTEVLAVVSTGLLVCLYTFGEYFVKFNLSVIYQWVRCSYLWMVLWKCGYCLETKFKIVKLLQFVSASQPINALAFILDGLHYGVSDFAYAARSMVSV